MARQAFDDPLAGSHASSGSGVPLASLPPPSGSFSSAPSGFGWKNLFWLAVAAGGLGFAGYLYLMPYRQLSGTLENRSRELHQEREEGQKAMTERDQLKSAVDKIEGTEKERADKAAKGRRDVEAMASQLKPALQELGAAVSTDDRGHLRVSLAPDKSIDKNGIDVSSDGTAVLKILAGAIKRSGGTARIKARFGSGPAPKQLRSLFGTTGEVAAVRAARVMSVLEAAGLAPDRLSIVGEPESPKDAPKPPPRSMSRHRRAAAAAAAAAAMEDSLDIEVEPG
jgi:hypothetical protein